MPKPAKPESPAKALERDVTQRVKDFLVARGWRPIRMQRTVMPGSFQTGEPGMSDYLFVQYLDDGACLCFWVEFKQQGRALRPEQSTWIERERKRGAVCEVVDDFATFAAWYEVGYSWLHTADGPKPGQVDMFAGVTA